MNRTGPNFRFLVVIVSLAKFKSPEVHLERRKMPRLWVTSNGTFARKCSTKHFTDRMRQSEASRHQPAGEPCRSRLMQLGTCVGGRMLHICGRG